MSYRFEWENETCETCIYQVEQLCRWGPIETLCFGCECDNPICKNKEWRVACSQYEKDLDRQEEYPETDLYEPEVE
jgi:hypothetical protein